MRFALIPMGLALTSLTGCKIDPAEPALSCTQSAASMCGPSACEQYGIIALAWPRLIVDMPVADGGVDVHGDQLTLTVLRGDGGADAAVPATGCPPFHFGLPCPYAFNGDCATGDMTIVVTSPDGRLEEDVQLAPFNYCGLDVAYVAVTADSNGTYIGKPQYITPCDMLGD